MALHDKPEPSLFRWNVLDRAQRISLGLTFSAAIVMVILLVYAIFAQSATQSGTPGAPHAWAPLAFFVRPSPTPVPLPTPTPTLTPFRIGIVAGHSGYDSGTVCDDGLTEAEVNLDIAQRVANALRIRGYVVDVLDEFDPRLNGYRALLLLSIHADSCEYINEEATGFKVARVYDSKVPEAEDQLVACLVEHYAARTGMYFHTNSITPDMASYHGFYEIAPDTPGAIIETGFLYLDRPLLTQRADLAAQGIVDGITCFLTSQ